MKKWLTVLLFAVLLVCCAACGSGNGNDNPTPTTDPGTESTDTVDTGKSDTEDSNSAAAINVVIREGHEIDEELAKTLAEQAYQLYEAAMSQQLTAASAICTTELNTAIAEVAQIGSSDADLGAEMLLHLNNYVDYTQPLSAEVGFDGHVADLEVVFVMDDTTSLIFYFSSLDEQYLISSFAITMV